MTAAEQGSPGVSADTHHKATESPVKRSKWLYRLLGLQRSLVKTPKIYAIEGTMDSLKRVLFHEYGGFADKRIKDLNKSDTFIADDRKPTDFGADKRLFYNFCSIFVRVQGDEKVQVELRGNVPLNSRVRQRFAELKSDLDDKNAVFSVGPGDITRMRDLAKSIKGIVAKGKRYSEKSYKFVCPRTATSLLRLADTLDRAWSTD